MNVTLYKPAALTAEAKDNPVVDPSSVAPAAAVLTLYKPAGMTVEVKTVAEVPAVPGTGIVLEDSYSGVSRDFYHHALQIKWRGPFIGAVLGVSPAFKAPGTVRIPLSSVPEILVVSSRAFSHNCRSRESGGEGPKLEVTYADGSTGVLQCLADADINSGTASPQGANTRLQLGTAILRFEKPTKEVASGAVVIQVYFTGGTATLQAAEFISPLRAAAPPVYGLRARQGINGPTVIHATDFNAPNWWWPWYTMVSARPTAEMAANQLTTYDRDTLEPLGRKSYYVETPNTSIPYNKLFPGSPAYIFPATIGRELEEVYFQYRLRLGSGYKGGTTQSGKLPGIASDTTIAGNGGAQTNGKNGWSFRGHFIGEPMAASSPYNSNTGVIPIGTYTYNPDQIAEHQITGLSYPATGRGLLGLLEVGQDYWIDWYVKVNTPGIRDGIVRIWIDGQLAYERTDHYMRDVPPYYIPGNLGINKVWMTYLHGGQALPVPTKKLFTYFSDWTIASEYIGPPDSGAVEPPFIEPPQVTITSPVNNAKLPPDGAFAIATNVVPGGAAVAKVDFFRDGKLVASDAVAPYGADLTGVPLGAHTLLAIATDVLGTTSYSLSVPVMVGTPVNVPPKVAIISPADGSTFAQSSPIAVSVTASDDGSVAKIQLYFDGFLTITMAGQSPYRTQFLGLFIGAHVLQAVATDNLGVQSSHSVGFTVT